MQLGILAFLRRSPKPFPPLPAAGPGHARSENEMAVAAAAPTPAPADELKVARPATKEERPLLPQPFQSMHYDYRLTLPVGWQPEAPQSIAGSPPIEQFRGPGDMLVGIWSEPCAIRKLPAVPPAERAFAIALPSARTVPFVAYSPQGQGGAQFLEGRWLASSRRWTIHVRTEAAERTATVQRLRELFASWSVAG